MYGMPIYVYKNIHPLVTPTNMNVFVIVRELFMRVELKNNVTLHSKISTLNGNRASYTSIHKTFGLLVPICTQKFMDLGM